jgi:two-component system sensor histidine kinase VicK
MQTPAGNTSETTDKIRQLEAENQALKAQLSRLHGTNQADREGFEGQLAFEKEFQESQARFRTIFEQSRLGKKIIASDLRILKVNQALVDMLGHGREELEGTRILEYVRADYLQPWKELQESLWTKQIPSFGFETVLVRKDGSWLWCSVTSILFRDGQDTLGYTILEDISGRKATEARLKKVYDAQEAIMHTVAHDLKSPIHNIRTLSRFLQKQLEKQPPVPYPQQSLQYIAMIEEACEKAYRIIEDLLLVGELESSDYALPTQTTDLNTFLQSQVALFGVTAQQKGVTIQVQLPAEPVFAPVHAQKLARVVDNLLSNAVKFTHPGGQITLSLQQETKQAILQVRDTGVGIPPSLQGSVFEKFTKANRSGTQGEETTGLGLFIAKQIVEWHNGRIWLESQEGEGTTFYVELPLGPSLP